MSLRTFIVILLVFCFANAGCSFQSELATTSTDSLGEWSPLGSRQVSRHTHFTLSSRYQLMVASIESAEEAAAEQDTTFARTLAKQLRQQHLSVMNVTAGSGYKELLSSARHEGADILLLAQVQHWPVKNCPADDQADVKDGQASAETCKPKTNTKDGMVLSVALYDVRERRLADTLTATSQRGMAGRMYDNASDELEQLCKMIAGQLSAH